MIEVERGMLSNNSKINSKENVGYQCKFKYNIVVIILVILCISEYLYFVFVTNDNNSEIFIAQEINEHPINEVFKQEKSCEMKKFFIWDKIIYSYMKTDKSIGKCTKTFKNDYYVLTDGILSIKQKNNVTCSFHCNYPKNDFDYTKGPTVIITQPIILDCDVFSIVCRDQSLKTVFEDVKFHIRKIENFTKEETPFLDKNFKIPDKNKQYDVHIYVVDSLSHYQTLRALPKTRSFLMDKLNGIEMKYLNTIADNSRPNAYGFLLNKQETNIIDIFGAFDVKKNDFGSKPSCETPLDNTTYILEYYRRMGYITLNAEDFRYNGAFNWPNCVGFKKSPAHYSLRPFQTIARNSETSGLFDRLASQKCYRYGFHLMDYMEEFLNKYENKTKMTLIWHTNLLHDQTGNAFFADDIYYEYFQRNEKHFNKSFNIFMSDHGYRMSSYASTDMGAYEHKNPNFIITVPEDLKTNEELMKNLNENSNKHISHLDVYATLLDLLTNAPKDGFKMLNEQKKFPIVNDKIKGLSLLRPLPKEDRSCYEMYVPPQYCLCNIKYQVLPTFMNEVRTNLSKAFIKAVNQKIIDGKLTEKCAEIKLDESEEFKVKVAKSGDLGIVYQIDAITVPGKAKYQTLMNKNFEVIQGEIKRLDTYKDQAEVCETKSGNRKFCYCKSLLSKKTEQI